MGAEYEYTRMYMRLVGSVSPDQYNIGGAKTMYTQDLYPIFCYRYILVLNITILIKVSPFLKVCAQFLAASVYMLL